MKAVLRKLVVCSTDNASAMTGVRAGFSAKVKALGAVDCWQFTDVAHECESSVHTAIEGLAFHSEILTGLRNLSAMLRKSNLVAGQVDALMQQENEKSASWQGKVVQRWVGPTLCLIKRGCPLQCCSHTQGPEQEIACTKKNDSPEVETGFQGTKKGETEHEKLYVIVTLLASLKFHVYTAVPQDVLTSLLQLSFEGQQGNACAARIASVLRTVKEELRELQNKHGPYERRLRHNLVVRKEVKRAVLHGWVLDSKGVGGADVTKTILLTKLLQQQEESFQNEAYTQLQVADFRTWQIATVTPEEMDKVVASEKKMGAGLP